MSRRVGVNSKGEMFDPSEEQTAGTMAEEYDKQQAKKSIQEKVVELLAVALDAVYSSSYEDEVKQKTLGLISRAQIPVILPSTGHIRKQCLGNVLYNWFKEKQLSLNGIPCTTIEVSKDPDEDMVNNPSHYQSYLKNGIDCITAMQHAFGKDATAIFCKLNAFKYNWRAESKNGNEDVSKAVWYLNKYLELNK